MCRNLTEAEVSGPMVRLLRPRVRDGSSCESESVVAASQPQASLRFSASPTVPATLYRSRQRQRQDTTRAPQTPPQSSDSQLAPSSSSWPGLPASGLDPRDSRAASAPPLEPTNAGSHPDAPRARSCSRGN